MDQDVDNAIKVLAKKVAKSSAPDEAMKFAQAALNLAHVEATRARTNSKPT